MDSSNADTPGSFILAERVGFYGDGLAFEAAAAPRPGLSQKSCAALGAVNHSDAEAEGRFADNTDPFEVKVGRPPVP